MLPALLSRFLLPGIPLLTSPALKRGTVWEQGTPKIFLLKRLPLCSLRGCAHPLKNVKQGLGQETTRGWERPICHKANCCESSPRPTRQALGRFSRGFFFSKVLTPLKATKSLPANKAERPTVGAGLLPKPPLPLFTIAN